MSPGIPISLGTRSVGCIHRERAGPTSCADRRKKVLGVCHRLNELVGKLPTFIRPEAVVYQVNQVLRGWANYFCYGTYTPALKIVHRHVCRRVRRWLRRKFKWRVKDIANIPKAIWSGELGLLNIRKLPRRHSWAKP